MCCDYILEVCARREGVSENGHEVMGRELFIHNIVDQDGRNGERERCISNALVRMWII